MLEKYISKQNLKKLLGRVIKNSTLVAPVRPYGEVLFEDVKFADSIVFDFENALNSPKDWVLLNDEDLLETASPQKKPLVIFGARACDTKAIGLLDKFFARTFKDPAYFKKRDSILIITLACENYGRNCFCGSVDGGPYLTDGFDIQLTDIGEGYFLEAASKKAEGFIKRYSGLIKNTGAAQKKLKEDNIKNIKQPEEARFSLENVYKNIGEEKAPDAFWKDLAQRCQSCGGCLLICPACSCFYVTDKKISAKKIARMRSLDACYYEGFSRMAGGYNPVATRSLMMRRKFYHKLVQQLDEFNQAGCTGCGRCNEICPGNVNWLESIKRIDKYV